MLPTTPCCFSRSTKNSTTWSSSRMATAVSRSFAETIISLTMKNTPGPHSCHASAARPRCAQHGGPLPTPGRREAAHHDEPQELEHQLTKRRILTLRMRPKLVRVAIIDDPP